MLQQEDQDFFSTHNFITNSSRRPNLVKFIKTNQYELVEQL